jgi:hypothetical protein
MRGRWREAGRRGGRNLTAKAVQVVVAVEVRGQGSGRVRMRIIPNASGDTLSIFVKDTVAGAPSSTLMA